MKNINNYSISKSLKQILRFGFIVTVVLYIDTIKKIPFYTEMLVSISLIIFLKMIFQLNLDMKKVKSNKRFYLENQFDKIRMIFNLIVGIGIITVPILQKTYETGPFEKISFILIGLSLIIPVTINRRSVSFDKTKNCNFKMEDSDFTITRTDKKITFSKFGIKLLKKNDQIHYINDLALNRDEVSNIMKSINSGLDTKSLEFYWLSESKIEKITATNKELR